MGGNASQFGGGQTVVNTSAWNSEVAGRTIGGSTNPLHVDGGAGLDTVEVIGPMSAYLTSASGNVITLSESKGLGQNASLMNVERVQFNDGVLAFDANGNAGNAYRLYQAAFDRTSDTSGLSYWTHLLDNGRLSLNQVAQYFTTSPEFKATFGANPSNAQVVDLFYHHVLGRAGEASGFNYWVDVLNRGIPKGEVLNGFANSVENHIRVDPVIAQGIVLDQSAFLV